MGLNPMNNNYFQYSSFFHLPVLKKGMVPGNGVSWEEKAAVFAGDGGYPVIWIGRKSSGGQPLPDNFK
jgi:hypothetical protein